MLFRSQVDVRAVPEESYGAALIYFTGSKAHNIALRSLANERKWKLNEYGLFAGKRRLAGATEEEVYGKLGLAYVPPELREDRGEIALAKAGTLPRLVTEGAAPQAASSATQGMRKACFIFSRPCPSLLLPPVAGPRFPVRRGSGTSSPPRPW